MQSTPAQQSSQTTTTTTSASSSAKSTTHSSSYTSKLEATDIAPSTADLSGHQHSHQQHHQRTYVTRASSFGSQHHHQPADRLQEQQQRHIAQVGGAPKQLRNHTTTTTVQQHNNNSRPPPRPAAASQAASPARDISNSSGSSGGGGSSKGRSTEVTGAASDSIDRAHNNNSTTSSTDQNNDNSSSFTCTSNSSNLHHHNPQQQQRSSSTEASPPLRPVVSPVPSPVANSSEQVSIEQQQQQPKVSQNSSNQKPADQRIKVTLSAPRNNSTDFQASEPILIDSETTTTKPLAPSSAQDLELDSGGSRRRRSTATTLISASISPPVAGGDESPLPSSGGRVSEATRGDTAGPVLSRSEQENELRRIASQRVKRNGNQVRDPVANKLLSAAATDPEPVQTRERPVRNSISQKQQQPQLLRKSLNSPTTTTTTTTNTLPLKPVSSQQQQQQQQPQPNSKQLAIYINGKIRSDSIFCRSSSSNSFNGLLNRFHGSTNTSQQQQQLHNNNKSSQFISGANQVAAGSRGKDYFEEEEEDDDDPESPLRLCRQISKQHHKQQQQQQQQQKKRARGGRKSRRSAKSRGGTSSAANFCHNLTKLFPNIVSQTGKQLDKASFAATSGSCYSGSSGGGQLSGSGSFEAATGAKGAEGAGTSYKLNPSSMFLRKAMRYYRIWIYCTNITILLGTLIFILSAFYVLSDYRMKLLVLPPHPQPSMTPQSGLQNPQDHHHHLQHPLQRDSMLAPSSMLSVETQLGGQHADARNSHADQPPEPPRPPDEPLVEKTTPATTTTTTTALGDEYSIQISYTEPYVLLAYAVIAIQAGLLQALGCFGAIRMKERWIQAFYYLILVLIALDVMLLMGWLNRYDYIVKSLQEHMSHRLQHQYGARSIHTNNNTNSSQNGSQASYLPEYQLSDNNNIDINLFSVRQEIDSKLDKILTCCGITNSLDYQQSLWRQLKLKQLEAELNQSSGGGGGTGSDAGERLQDLISTLPLVPASCCRRTPPQARRGRPVILDDSQIKHPNRVPGWSPSMVVDNLRPADQRHRKPTAPKSEADEQFEGSGYYHPGTYWSSGGDELEHHPSGGDGGGGKLERRLLAKQESFNTQPPASVANNNNQEDEEERGRRRRWVVEMMVDNDERVLSRLIEEEDLQVDHSSSPRLQQLARLRSLLFVRPEGWTEELNCYTLAHFRWPNKLQLTFEQYKTIESYLLEEEKEEDEKSDGEKQTNSLANKLHLRRRRRSQPKPPTKAEEAQEDETGCSQDDHKCNNNNIKSKARRAQRSSSSSTSGYGERIKRLVEKDPELSCAPRSYYDLRAIHTRGCYPDIKAWLDSSAHILFVTGFCILTVLKFCSVVLLRLEIREMIHKIRVLKGMATEYNALHDLEAYLPRPSLCAAELTPSGVALAAPTGSASATGAPGAAGCTFTASAATGSISGMSAPPHRLGGSFSEAVAAATAAAHGNAALGLGGLAHSGRAASMKAVAAMSNMLTPTLCPRSSSVSAAQLQAAASLLAGGGGGSCTLQAGGSGGLMSRRHTAVSVCPSAAAAVAAAAAQHPISRRGTYTAKPTFGGGGDNPAGNLMCSGSSLFQHRHSAHTVHTLLSRPSSQQQQQQVANSGAGNKQQQQQHANKRSSRHYLGDTPSGATTFEHQSSGESANQLSAASASQQHTGQARSSGGSHQLLSLVYPFKRQSSGGAQSAGNFSLDLAPPGSLAESRRSIH